MITTRFYLDCRAVAHGYAAPLRLVITKSTVRAYVPLSITLLPSQWDARRQLVVGHPRKVALNNLLQSKKLAVDNIIFRLVESGELVGLSAVQIKNRVIAELYPPEDAASTDTPHSCYLAFMEKKSGRTRELYNTTLSRLRAFHSNFAALHFEEITPRWLEDFDDFLAKTSPSRNARNIHLRNLRAVFNYAIDEGLTTFYPFRKFKIRPVKTRKRALTLEQLRKFFSLPVDPGERRYFDFAKLSFLLCGINVVDLCAARKPVNGRLEYERAKTHRLYSIKIEPEAAAIISQYEGLSGLVNFAEGCKSYRSFYKHLADTLRNSSNRIGVDGFSSYWMRHTWATIARKLKISVDDIALALGHSNGHEITRIYIDEDLEAIDAANRRVIDWVLYDKK